MNLVRAFFPKSGHFSLKFKKGHGRPSYVFHILIILIYFGWKEKYFVLKRA